MLSLRPSKVFSDKLSYTEKKSKQVDILLSIRLKWHCVLQVWLFRSCACGWVSLRSAIYLCTALFYYPCLSHLWSGFSVKRWKLGIKKKRERERNKDPHASTNFCCWPIVHNIISKSRLNVRNHPNNESRHNDSCPHWPIQNYCNQSEHLSYFGS